MTLHEEKRILEDPGTREFVKHILDMAQHRDCVDAMNDIQLAFKIQKSRTERALGLVLKV